MCYVWAVDVTVRKLDEDLYRRLKAAAALNGRTVGELLNEAIRSYLGQDEEPRGGRRASLLDLAPEDYGPGQERLSEEIDAVAYGGRGGA